MKILLSVLFISFSFSIRGQVPELIKDIVPGVESSTFLVDYYRFAIDSTYFFQTNTPQYGKEMWMTRGTESSTQLLKDIQPASDGGSQSTLIWFNDYMYFIASDGSSDGKSIWRTNGTPEGTELFKDEITLQSSKKSCYAILGDKLVFQGFYEGFGELWISDGTTAGTQLLKQINTTGGGSNPLWLTNFKDKIFFTAGNTIFNKEIWVTDGTASGTEMFFDLNGNTSSSSDPEIMNVVNGWLYFSAKQSSSTGRELWKTDGTIQGTVLVKDILPGSGNGIASNTISTKFGKKMLFFANDGMSGTELWLTDSETDSTYMVKDVFSGSESPDIKDFLMVNDSFALLSISSPDYGAELWRTDGTEQGTYLLKDIQPGTAEGVILPYLESSITEYKGILYFVADDGVHGPEIWKTDGTTNGTVMLTDMQHNISVSLKNNLYVINGYLFFTAATTPYGYEVWKLLVDPTTSTTTERTELIKVEISPNPAIDHVTISGYIDEKTNIAISLLDLNGKIITKSSMLVDKGPFIKEVQVPALSQGIYYIQIQSDKGVKTLPIIIHQ